MDLEYIENTHIQLMRNVLMHAHLMLRVNPWFLPFHTDQLKLCGQEKNKERQTNKQKSRQYL